MESQCQDPSSSPALGLSERSAGAFPARSRRLSLVPELRTPFDSIPTVSLGVVKETVGIALRVTLGSFTCQSERNLAVNQGVETLTLASPSENRVTQPECDRLLDLSLGGDLRLLDRLHSEDSDDVLADLCCQTRDAPHDGIVKLLECRKDLEL